MQLVQIETGIRTGKVRKSLLEVRKSGSPEVRKSLMAFGQRDARSISDQTWGPILKNVKNHAPAFYLRRNVKIPEQLNPCLFCLGT